MLGPVLRIIKPLFCFFMMKDRIFMLCVCVWTFSERLIDTKYVSDYTRMRARDLCTGCVAVFATAP